MNVLVVIDMQHDFVDGSLGSPQAQAIVDNVRQKIVSFDGPVIFTRDTHDTNYLESQEGQHLPVAHCVKDTIGWQIMESLITAAEKRNTSIRTLSLINLILDPLNWLRACKG